MLGTYQGLQPNKKGWRKREPAGRQLSSLSKLPGYRCDVTPSLMLTPPNLKQWATANPSLGSFGQELCYSNEVECVSFTSGARPCVNWCSTSSLGGQKQYLAPSTMVPISNWDTIPPEFTLGHQWVYWAFLQSIDVGLLTEMWVLPQKVTLESPYPAEMMAFL